MSAFVAKLSSLSAIENTKQRAVTVLHVVVSDVGSVLCSGRYHPQTVGPQQTEYVVRTSLKNVSCGCVKECSL